MAGLTDAKVRTAKATGKAYKPADGGQLYLHVSAVGGRTWRMNYQFGKNATGRPVQKTLTIGTYPAISLKDARDGRDVAKTLLAKGVEPKPNDLFERAAPVADTRLTFEAIGVEWHRLQKSRWSAVHAQDVMDNLKGRSFPPSARFRSRTSGRRKCSIY